jgi:hypothetical protein
MRPGRLACVAVAVLAAALAGLPASAQTSPTQTSPAQTAPAQTAPARTASAQTSPAQTAPAQTAAAQTAPAQSQQQPPVHPLPPDAELDALLAAHKWHELAAALSHLDSPASLYRSLNWLEARLDAGGGLLIGLIDARTLWEVGEHLHDPDPRSDLRLTAGMVTLYTFEMIVIDGARCADTSAPANRVLQLRRARQDTLLYLKQQPDAVQNVAIDMALALEKKTAPLRGEDDLVCRGGVAEFQATAERGAETPGPDTRAGPTVAVRPPADWTPAFVGPAVYEPLQARARAGMPAALVRLIEQAGTEAPNGR